MKSEAKHNVLHVPIEIAAAAVVLLVDGDGLGLGQTPDRILGFMATYDELQKAKS